jgi:hypothetical protein
LSTRKALIVGINHYDHIGGLNGCVNDARSVMARLDRHADGSVNFAQPKMMLGIDAGASVNRMELKDAVRQLFADDNDVALFYFAGHGYLESTGGYLCASDCRTGDDGLPLSDIMTLANQSPARNKVIILDSCHSGALGEHPLKHQVTEITEGMTILTASTKEQFASELNGGGVFTGLLTDALDGAAADLMGQVTPGSIYAHIDQSLGTWSQRPIFKTNVKRFVSLRQTEPPISLTDLRRIDKLFPGPGFQFPLNPSYEPEHPDANPEHTAIFAILQKYNRVNLLVPVDAPHMYHAAIGSKRVRLTATGEHYRRLVSQGLI